MPDPVVSVITATYNRSNVLRLAIASLLRSSFANWELIVVGDCCTDDTEAVVRAFGDARIRFVNLEQNHGEQSAPNNEGFRLSRGRYVAYLNHDDLWLPDHLETLVPAIEAEGADLVFSMLEVIEADGTPTLSGATPGADYVPYVYVPASSWLVRRELLDELGGWRAAKKTHNVPSQDVLFRAWLRGKRMRLVPKMTGVAIPSGGRAGVYARRDADENRSIFEAMSDASFRERELMKIARRAVSKEADSRVLPKLSRAIENSIRQACVRLGLHPGAVRNFARYGRKGGFIDHLRKVRGLEKKSESR